MWMLKTDLKVSNCLDVDSKKHISLVKVVSDVLTATLDYKQPLIVYLNKWNGIYIRQPSLTL